MDNPSFMNDSSRNNHGYEAMLDFQMSWLLRVAMGHSNPKLLSIARKVLLKMINREVYSEAEIKRVEVWKQWARIDLTAEIDVVIDNKLEHHIVVIENKAYTFIHDDQLSRYKKTIDEYYHNNIWKKTEKHFWVITFFDPSEEGYGILEEQCKDSDWKLIDFYSVIDWKEGFEKTDSDLFDEFWLKTWY